MSCVRSRSGGTSNGMTFSRKRRSVRKFPFSISTSSRLFVAAITRTSTRIGVVEPTGSKRCSSAKRGKFEMADGATLFLDEVGDMSARKQAQVLRVLEEQRFEPVRPTNPMRADVRLSAG